jgi:hypothetical protein
MSSTFLNLSKAAELRIATWFLEAGWEVFTPFVDARQTDFVVRVPKSEELLAIQVKSRQRETLNVGQLNNEWRDGKAPFDYLVLIDGARQKGVIFAKSLFQKYGRTISVLTLDAQRYSRGVPRPVFERFAYDLSETAEWDRGVAFCEAFSRIHREQVEELASTSADTASARKLSWAETFAEMASENEDWTEWDVTTADGIDEPEKI